MSQKEMKILTKQICFEGDSTPLENCQVNRAANRPNRRKRFTFFIPSGGPLVVAGIGLAIALSACGGSPTAQQTSPEKAATEAVQTPTDSSEAASTLFVKDGVAIEGADPVAYFTEEAYVPGSPEYTYDWQGATWQFSSAENRDLFAANPEQYAPEYGGFCAWAVAAKNALVPVDPNAWSVVDGKLYLNANQKVQANWLEDVPGFISQADDNWPELSQS